MYPVALRSTINVICDKHMQSWLRGVEDMYPVALRSTINVICDKHMQSWLRGVELDTYQIDSFIALSKYTLILSQSMQLNYNCINIDNN